MRTLNFILRSLVVVLALPLLAATYTVTNTNDSGPGSLRFAMEEVKGGGGGTIQFAIPGSGEHTIYPLSTLPAVRNAVIDATTQPGYAGTPLIVISGGAMGGGWVGLDVAHTEVRGLNLIHFVYAIDAREGTTVRGCWIGRTPTEAMNTTSYAVYVHTGGGSGAGVTIGGAGAYDGNVLVTPQGTGIFIDNFTEPVLIDGNYFGTSPSLDIVQSGAQAIFIQNTRGPEISIGTQAPNVILGGRIIVNNSEAVNITGNFIGVTPSGHTQLSNGSTTSSYPNIDFVNATDNRVANNSIGGGIHVREVSVRNVFSQNSMYLSGIWLNAFTSNDTFDADSGPNNWINHPNLFRAALLGNVTRINGAVHSTPNRTYTVELFSDATCTPNEHSWAKTYLDSVVVTTDANGSALFTHDVQALPVGTLISATLTSAEDGTSPFTAFCKQVEGPGRLSVRANSSTGAPEGQPVDFLIERTDGTAGEVSVQWTLTNDTAAGGSDYVVASGTAVFPDNEKLAQVLITTIDDLSYEATESLVITLSNPTGGATILHPSASGLIRDNDTPPKLTATASVEVLEGNSGFSQANVEFQLDRAAGIPIALKLRTSTTGLTASADDFLPFDTEIEIDPGETQLSLAIQIIGDTTPEPDESFFLLWSAYNGGATNIRILNDDTPADVSIAPFTVAEGNDIHLIQVPVTANKPFTGNVTYVLHQGSASSGSDYSNTQGTLSFNNETTKTISIAIIGDNNFEQDETFTIELIHAGGLYTLVNDEALVTLINDDALAEMSIESATMTEGDTGVRNAELLVIVDRPLLGSVRYTIEGGTAAAGSDYTDTSGLLLFSNETAKHIQIPIKGDVDPEANEQLTVTLSHHSGSYTIINGEATLTILNDDAGVGPAQQWIAAGTSATYAIRLGAPAPEAATITVNSSSPEVVSVPATIHVPAGAIDLTFDAHALLAGGSSTITLTFPPSLGGATRSVEALTYAATDVVFTPNTVNLLTGQSTTVKVSLHPAFVVPVEATVSFDSAIVNAPTRITIPAGGDALLDITAVGVGPIFLRVTLPQSYGERQGTLTGSVTAPDGPAIVRVTPSTGPVAGSTIVEITGARFTPDCIVRFGGFAALSQQFISATHINARTPAHAPGSVPVTLTCGDQTATLENAFTYLASGLSIASVLPQSGSTAGGTLVRVLGSNLDSSCWLTFGGVPATDVDVLSATELIAEVPPHAAGEVNVHAQCTGGITAARLFTYVATDEPSASLLTVTPLSASPGEPVTITGLRFRSDDMIEIGGKAAEIIETLPDAHVVNVPELPPGKTSIDLIDAKGRRVTLGPIFTVTEAAVQMRVQAYSPTPVPAGGEVLVYVTGYRPGHTFRIGGKPATIVWRTYRQVRVRLAHDTPAGSQLLEIITPSGQVLGASPTIDVIATGLLIRGITPNCATTDGLVQVTIHGTGFTPMTAIRFDDQPLTGENPAWNFTFVDSTTIIGYVPPHPAGLVTITAAHNEALATLTNGFEYYSQFDPNGGCSGRRSRGARH